MSIVKRVRKVFVFNAPAYKRMVRMYTVKDGIIALALSVAAVLMIMVAARYSIIGVLHFVLALTPFLVLRYSKDKLETLGFTRKNFGKSFLLGLCLGIPFFFIVPTSRFWPLNLPHQTILRVAENMSVMAPHITFSSLLFGFLYFAVITPLAEEVFCRGLIQTRIYGIIKSDFWAILFGGVFFAIIHMPFRVQFFVYRQYDVSYAASILLYLRHYFLLHTYLMFIGFHLLFNYLYRKYNSIVAPLVLHFLIDLRVVFGHT